MSNRIPWNKYETALLIDTYIAVDEKKQPRNIAVKTLSKLLRDMGEMNGVEVDEIYRNENGISMRMYEIERLFNDGKGGLKNTSRLFVEMVEMYKNDRNGFNQILKEAKNMTNHTVSKKELFGNWLQNQVDIIEDTHVIVESLDTISMFTMKHKMSKHSIWEMTDPDEIEAICATLLRSYLFKHFHREEAKQLPYYFQCLQAFLASLKDENNVIESEAIVTDNLFQDITKNIDIDFGMSNVKNVVADGYQEYSINVESRALDTECDESIFEIEILNDDIPELVVDAGSKIENLPDEINHEIEAKEETEPVNKRTIVDAVVMVMEKESRPMTVSEIYSRIIEEDLYTFGAKEPEQVIAKQIKRTCRDSNIKLKTKKEIFYFYRNKEGKNCYYLLSRENEYYQNEKFLEKKENTVNYTQEYIRTSTDEIFHNKYAVIFKRIFFVMKNSEHIAFSEDEIQKKIGHIGRTSTVKYILEHASWSEHVGEKYKFSKVPIEYTLEEDEKNLLVFSVKTDMQKSNYEHKIEKIENDEKEESKNPEIIVDFNDLQEMNYTKPLFFLYFEEKFDGINDWEDLYVRIIACLLDDYPHILYGLINQNINGAGHNDFADNEEMQHMLSPIRIEEKFYIETKLSESQYLTNIRILLDKCLVDYENLEIHCRKIFEDNLNEKKEVIEPITETKRYSSNNKTFLSSDQLNTVDFYNIASLAYTKPYQIVFFNRNLGTMATWKEAYVKIVTALYQNYQDKIPVGISLVGGNRIDIGDKENMVAPKHLFEELYLETNLCATDIIKRVKILLDICNIAYQNLSIEYQNKELTCKNNQEIRNRVYQKLYSISKIYDDPSGFTVSRIMTILGEKVNEEIIRDILEKAPWARKLSDDVYTFAKKILNQITTQPEDFDKVRFEETLLRRYRNGMQFDSIDLENFREMYENMFDEKLSFDDIALEKRLKNCGVIYKDRLFPAEGIIDRDTKIKLFSFIDNCFASGKTVLYYKALYEDLSDMLSHCFTLSDADMLREYIKYAAEKGKYYFFSNYMTKEKNVIIDHNAEVEEYFLNAGKPVATLDVCNALSHIPKEQVSRIITFDNRFQRNAKGEYFHVDILEISDLELEKISKIIGSMIEENEYAIWTDVWNEINETMPILIENNVYLSGLGMRNVLGPKFRGRLNFEGAVICAPPHHYSMRDVYQLYAKHHDEFSVNDIYNLSKELDTVIYFDALAEVSVRVSHDLFVSKSLMNFDVDEIDQIIGSYMSKDYICIREIDSFLAFPNAGYEWNEYLLESFVNSYSQKFLLMNNGLAMNNVAGAVVKKKSGISDFSDVCAAILADSGITLHKKTALDYLVEINMITRRSYREIESVIIKAKQLLKTKG